MSAYRSGLVYVQDLLAGRISETEEGYEFTYDPEWLSRLDASAVSLTLPLVRNAMFPVHFFPSLMV